MKPMFGNQIKGYKGRRDVLAVDGLSPNGENLIIRAYEDHADRTGIQQVAMVAIVGGEELHRFISELVTFASLIDGHEHAVVGPDAIDALEGLGILPTELPSELGDEGRGVGGDQ